MTLENGAAPMQIESDKYIDVTKNAKSLSLGVDVDIRINIYITNFVWERYIVWTMGENDFFNVNQTQHERQEQILKDSINFLSACNKVIPDKELFFNRNILVRKTHIAEPELALFRLNTAVNENDESCLIIDAVNIT